jgi:peptidoglycan/xylan/chitin deacetylase (PgdA/CDA1 family)
MQPLLYNSKIGIIFFSRKNKVRKLLIFIFASILMISCSTCITKIESTFSQRPPGSLKVYEVPQFITFGFDDNGFSGLENSGGTGGVKFIIDLFASRYNPSGTGNERTYDGAQTHFSMYCVTGYIDNIGIENPVFVKRAWREALLNGNEIGVHTHQHKHGIPLSVEEWESEIQTCIDWLTKPFDSQESIEEPDNTKGIGMNPSEIYGFRAPYLEYSDNAFQAVFSKGFLYDSSIEEGFQDDQDGTNFFWPYKLDMGSPGDKISAQEQQRKPISAYPGLWEIPGHAVIVPPDSLCAKYGVKPGLRRKMKQAQDYFDEENGKITGFDWNLWILFGMTKAEFLATLKYSLDLRLKGNRCPMAFGTHSDIYSSKFQDVPNATVEERQEALIEFIDYALSKPWVRIVSAKELLDWRRDPSPL